MKKTAVSMILMSSMFSCSVFAASVVKPHVEMSLINSNQSNWQVLPAMVKEKGHFYDDNDVMIPPGTSVNIDNTIESYVMGWSFVFGDDFHVAYRLTATMGATGNTAAPYCVFDIGAYGPAQPHITVSNYNNAQCLYTDDGKGGEYYLNA